jgi:hypothetical protein
MHGEIPVGCITATNHISLLIIDFDFRRGGAVFGRAVAGMSKK